MSPSRTWLLLALTAIGDGNISPDRLIMSAQRQAAFGADIDYTIWRVHNLPMYPRADAGMPWAASPRRQPRRTRPCRRMCAPRTTPCSPSAARR